jgi:hypothetical protein
LEKKIVSAWLMQPLEKSRIVQFLTEAHIGDILWLHLDCPGIEAMLRHEP